MELKDKANSLSDRMNKLSEKFDLSDELIECGDEFIEDKTQEIELFKDKLPITEIINLEIMVNDFKFVRDTLQESTENGRRVLNIVTLDILEAGENERRDELISSFAEMNTAVANNIKLYIMSYKEISRVLLNIDKIQKQNIDSDSPKTVHNTINVSTADLIKALKNEST